MNLKQTEFWFISGDFPPSFDPLFKDFLKSLSDWTSYKWNEKPTPWDCTIRVALFFNHPSEGKPYFDRLQDDCQEAYKKDHNLSYSWDNTSLYSLSYIMAPDESSTIFTKARIYFSSLWADSIRCAHFHYIYCHPDLNREDLKQAPSRLYRSQQ